MFFFSLIFHAHQVTPIWIEANVVVSFLLEYKPSVRVRPVQFTVVMNSSTQVALGLSPRTTARLVSTYNYNKGILYNINAIATKPKKFIVSGSQNVNKN